MIIQLTNGFKRNTFPEHKKSDEIFNIVSDESKRIEIWRQIRICGGKR